MYDVPVAVKDALRSGAYRKNYRFVLGEEAWHEVGSIKTIGMYSPSTNYGDDKKYTIRDSKTYKFIVDDADHDTYALYIYKGSDPNWMAVTSTSRNTWDITITDEAYTYVEIKSTTGNLVYPVSVQNYYAETIDNDNLVAESVNIDERMCSGDTLKFGLCEGSSLEFQYFDKPNITGKRVQVFIDVDYGANEPYTIPLGFFDVKNCSRQASTGIIKASCYNKLMSDYLDAQANESIQQLTGDAYSNNYICATSALGELLKEYSINTSDNYIPIRIGISTGSYLNSYASWLVKLNGQSSTIRIGIGAGYQTIMLLSDGLDGTKLVKVESIEKYLLKLEASINDLKSYIYTNIQNPDTIWDRMYGSEIDNTWSINVYYLSGGMHKYYLDGMTNGVGGNRFIKDLFYLRDVTSISFNMPRILYETQSLDDPGYGLTLWTNPYSFDESDYPVLALLDHSSSDDIILEKDNLPAKVTLRELQSAVYETQCQFGQLSRITDLFSGVELNHSRLLPADTLYPSDSLYPDGAAESAFRSQYSKLWADEGNVHKWRYLIITYKGLDENNQEAEFTLQRTVNADGTDDYNMSDNWLFRNLVWTASDVGDYADAMVLKMQDITWFPFEMWAAGLPYLEVGDEIEIPLGEETYTSYILQRRLNGIQNLQDTYINGTLDIF